MATNKPRVIKDFEKLSEELQDAVRAKYPTGYFKYMVDYFDREGNKKSALPFETEEFLYLVKMPPAAPVADDDDDFDNTKKRRKSKSSDEEDDGFADLDEMGQDDEPSESYDDSYDDY
ncbi:hypothetical protein GC194_12210 [bacterium]|nr:hypothetical protein [bacterium]